MGNLDNNKDYIKLPINSDFKVDDLAKKYLTSGTYVIGKYSLDKDKLNKVIDVVKSAGVSPAFFLAYSIAEGGGAGNWVNHFSKDTGDYLQGAKDDANWMTSIAGQSGQVTLAWDDPTGGIVGKVPQDVRDAGDKDAQTLGVNTIGRLYLQGTAAATWAAYYPELLKKSVNGVQDFGDPIAQTREQIKAWGSDGGSGGDIGNGSDNEKKYTEEEMQKARKDQWKKAIIVGILVYLGGENQ